MDQGSADRFRPLLGFFISKFIFHAIPLSLIPFSSHAGVLYFKMRIKKEIGGKAERFSSPAGVLYFKIREDKPSDGRSPFSSPAGVLYFKIG